MDHLCDTSDNHVADSGRSIALHDVFEGSQKVFLESKVCKLSLFDKLHSQLTQRIDGEEGNILITARSHLVEVVT